MAEIVCTYYSSIKYQLRPNLNNISERTKRRIIRKSLQAVDNVLDNIAPRQIESIYNRNNVADDIGEAIQTANGSNSKIQLLSCDFSVDLWGFTVSCFH